MVYLQDKSGLVAQPPLQGSDQEAVIFERGEIINRHLKLSNTAITLSNHPDQFYPHHGQSWLIIIHCLYAKS